MRRVVFVLYCVAIWFLCDLVYSNLLYKHEVGAPIRVWNDQYHHGLAPKTEAMIEWGRLRNRLTTNSLGFRDATMRDVPLKSDRRRILLIGDSFAEGLGVEYAESFAGRLDRAGQDRNIEVLDAGVVSYSPVIYYRKIEHLLAVGLAFDEVVVLSDISDVQDEATTYFCIDDDPRYRAHCQPREPAQRRGFKRWLQGHFVITDRISRLLQHRVRLWLGTTKRRVLYKFVRSAWTVPGFDVGNRYAPLGVEGGIARSVQNMQALADLLAARRIPLTIAVYPWPMQLALDDRNSRQVAIWRDFCAKNCKAFIDLFPAFFAAKDADPGWYERLYIPGDVHFSVEGNGLVFRELARHLIPPN